MAPWLIPLAVSGVNLLGNLIGNRQQHKSNMKMAKWQAAYNDPARQRQRWEGAGMNPNLAYGQGTPGNAEMPRNVDVQAAYADIGSKFQASQLMSAQTDLTKVKTDESGVKQELMRAQKDLVRSNPFMRKEYVDAMVTKLKATADLKAQEASFMLSTQKDVEHLPRDGSVKWERGYLKMQRELDNLALKFNLGSADAKLKASVLESKDFQNWMNDFTRRFMADGELNREHMMWFLKLLMSNMMSAAVDARIR